MCATCALSYQARPWIGGFGSWMDGLDTILNYIKRPDSVDGLMVSGLSLYI